MCNHAGVYVLSVAVSFLLMFLVLYKKGVGMEQFLPSLSVTKW